MFKIRKFFRSRSAKTLGLILLVFVLGILTGTAGANFSQRQAPPKVQALRESDIPSSSGYTFTDPLIGLSSSDSTTPAAQYVHLDTTVATYIAQQKQNGLYSASIKFADIEQSGGFIINPDEEYDPASLTKVPLMMAYYYLAETDPSILSDQIRYAGQPDLDADEQIESKTQLTPGMSYSVDEMIDHMITYSDNNAEQLLADHLAATDHLDVLNNLFGDLGIKIDPQNTDNMAVQSYSLFLRVLFNATYLDRADSEKALKLLSETEFADGIRVGVPSSIPIAEKFGDARMIDAAGTQVGVELQNCGLVYYPDHTYLLCIMTKGDTVAHLESVIAGISKTIYQDMAARYPEKLPN
jgi:beta-lactamase class A